MSALMPWPSWPISDASWDPDTPVSGVAWWLLLKSSAGYRYEAKLDGYRADRKLLSEVGGLGIPDAGARAPAWRSVNRRHGLAGPGSGARSQRRNPSNQCHRDHHFSYRFPDWYAPSYPESQVLSLAGWLQLLELTGNRALKPVGWLALSLP